ncbi:hypothetical protein CJP74_03390 [Psittacicella melopsittaci]|uniref:DNA mismatch repair protein MutL n=1 Tax=Psittacicella melopsittaci TaxID=2028576 RepID=A0A3A1Y3D1_9GAMM|nr:DNA mismatch repair endonuclease MutL [Psittacicella melopsittaci]RIY32842.1 hypothetical protein CJP74_03390 [Psittacicella melopsittaci]
MTNIQILPPLVANQIAAGEVVERPASIVKELVENSIDAQATSISVDIEDGGKELIRIRDNGQGIEKDQLDLALAPHATSKLRNIDDLSSLVSYGFRGEALASISSVAKLTLTSRHHQADVAWQIYNQGKEYRTSSTPVAHPQGTSIEVRELFFNTPARQKFLKSGSVEYNHIEDLIQRMAIVNPAIDWTLSHNGKQRLRLRALAPDDFKGRIQQIMPQTFSASALEIKAQIPLFNLKLRLIVEPNAALTTRNNKIQYSYINQRMIKDKVVISAVKQAFEELFNNVNLSYILFLEIDSQALDVNVHPAKAEVRFVDAHKVHSFIFQNLYVQLARIRNFDPKIVDLVLANRQEEQNLIDRSQVEELEQLRAKANSLLKPSHLRPQGETKVATRISAIDNKNSFAKFSSPWPGSKEKTSNFKEESFSQSQDAGQEQINKLVDDLFALTPETSPSKETELQSSASQNHAGFNPFEEASQQAQEKHSQEQSANQAELALAKDSLDFDPLQEPELQEKINQALENLNRLNEEEPLEPAELTTSHHEFFKELERQSQLEPSSSFTPASPALKQQQKQSFIAEKNTVKMLDNLLGKKEAKAPNRQSDEAFEPSLEAVQENTQEQNLAPSELLTQVLQKNKPNTSAWNLDLLFLLEVNTFASLVNQEQVLQALALAPEQLSEQNLSRPHWFFTRQSDELSILTCQEQQTLWQIHGKVYLISNFTFIQGLQQVYTELATKVKHEQEQQLLLDFVQLLQQDKYLANLDIYATVLLVSQALGAFTPELVKFLTEKSYAIL